MISKVYCSTILKKNSVINKNCANKNISFGNLYDNWEENSDVDDPLAKWRARYYNQMGVHTTPLESNIKKVDSNKNIYTSGMKAYEDNPKLLERLNKLHINTVIDIRSDASWHLQKLCKECGIDYKSYPTQNTTFWETPSVFKNRQELLQSKRQELISLGRTEKEVEIELKRLSEAYENEHEIFMQQKFFPMIETLCKGNCVLGCTYAEDATPKLMSLLTRVEPNFNKFVNEFPLSERHVKLLKNFIENLTSNDMKMLGITETFLEKIKTEIRTTL